MWNVNIRKGTIWNVKSLNQYDYNFPGMKFCGGRILILSAFEDTNGQKKFTYCNLVDQRKASDFDCIKIKQNTYYVDITSLYTGDQRALESFVTNIDDAEMKRLIKSIRFYFRLGDAKDPALKSEKVDSSNKKKSTKKKYSRQAESLQIKDLQDTEGDVQRRIFKFGIEVYVVESEHVHISPTNKIILSEEAREDIVYNSKTDDDIRILCDKYKIYPLKAIKEIRNRLVYQHKQKEG